MIGARYEDDGLLRVNGWSLIAPCRFNNYVLYMYDDTNFLDLRDVDIHWFKHEAEIWWTEWR